MGKKTSYLTELIEKSKRWRAAGGGQDETSSSDEEDEDDGRGEPAPCVDEGGGVGSDINKITTKF